MAMPAVYCENHIKYMKKAYSAPEKMCFAMLCFENLVIITCTLTQKKTLNIDNTLCFDVLLTVRLSIFISVFNQLDAQNFFHNKFYFMPIHVSSTCAHLQEVSLWYHHTYRRDDTRGYVMLF